MIGFFFGMEDTNPSPDGVNKTDADLLAFFTRYLKRGAG